MMQILIDTKSQTHEINKQQKAIEVNKLLIQSLNGMNIFVIILNKNREIIFMNNKLQNALNILPQEAIGLRPGKLLKCRYADVSEQGCGYAKQCTLCEAKNLVVEAINTGNSTEGVVSIVSAIGGLERTSTFEEKVTILEVDKEKYYMLAFVDKSLEVERYNMERIFFHDILNTATSLYSAIELLKMDNEKFRDDDEFQIIERVIKNIVDEIEYQRNITRAERDDLLTTIIHFNLVELCKDVTELMEKDKRFHNIPINIVIEDEISTIYTDKTLLRRILINLLKNALEESKPDQTVTVKVVQQERVSAISIHNDEPMPEYIKRNIFEKGHSKKGLGRGFGTYGSKLLLNKYMNGDLTFISSEDEGTTFTITIKREVL